MRSSLVKRSQIFLLVLSAVIASCSGKKETSAEQTTWAEMDSFHMIMAEAYHPLKDSANLAPARATAELMAAEAEKWAGTALPERVDYDDMKARLEGLKANTRAFADMVNGGATDEELATSLTAVHDEFHHIMEMWEGGHKDHH